MSEKQDEEIQIYFNKLRSGANIHCRQMSQISEIQQKIKNQIDNGNLGIEQRSEIKAMAIQKLSQQIKSKKQKMNKDLLLLNFSSSLYLQKRNCTKSKRAKSTRSYRKENIQLSLEEIDEYKLRKIDAEGRLRNLNKMKEQLIRERQKIDGDKQMKRINKIEQEKQKQQKRRKQIKNQKLARIKQRIMELQDNRVKRIENLKSSYVSSTPKIPKYKLMQKQFVRKQHQIEQNRKQDLAKHIQNKTRQYSHQNLKSHSDYYKKLLQKRNESHKILTKLSKDFFQNREKQFCLMNQNPEQLLKSKQKLKIIRNFQEVTKLKRIVMKQDSRIGLSFQIAKDKAKYPFKYHYLKKKKQISDEEIYENYSHFNFNSDHVEIGNFYLEEIKNVNYKSRLTQNTQSERKGIKTQASSVSEKKKHKNYLEDCKKNGSKKKKDQVDQLIRQYGQKSKVIQILQNRSEVQKNNALKKITKLKTPSSYSKTLKLQEQIDEQFINSIKTKLKCLQIK